MNISEFIKESLVGKILLDSEFSKGETGDEYSWRGLKIKKAFIAQSEGREDAVLYLEFEDDNNDLQPYFYLNDTLILQEPK